MDTSWVVILSCSRHAVFFLYWVGSVSFYDFLSFTPQIEKVSVISLSDISFKSINSHNLGRLEKSEAISKSFKSKILIV